LQGLSGFGLIVAMSQLLWTQKQDVGPSPRWGPAMVYDSERARVLLFGGYGNTNFGDTWEWDTESWTQVEDIGPSARWGHGMAYDSARHRVVLFGGAIIQGTNTHSLGDTWEWDGESWTQTADTGPSARHGVALAYDSKRRRTVLFGGEQLPIKQGGAGSLFGDTWIWDGVEWTQEQDSGPSQRDWYGMANDDQRDRVVLFGGLTYRPNDSDYTMLNDTWEYDATKWTRVADTGPSPRNAMNLCYNGKSMLLFGGGVESLTHGITVYRDTWQWDGKHWTERQDMGPPARFSAAASGDTTRNRVVLFGGGNTSTDFGDTWEQFERALAAPGPG
jgi:N-acetylneuraminic acid mutarotase